MAWLAATHLSEPTCCDTGRANSPSWVPDARSEPKVLLPKDSLPTVMLEPPLPAFTRASIGLGVPKTAPPVDRVLKPPHADGGAVFPNRLGGEDLGATVEVADSFSNMVGSPSGFDGSFEALALNNPCGAGRPHSALEELTVGGLEGLASPERLPKG
jgi:hypothetical protein